MNMNKRLKEERDRLGITQAKVADLFGIKPQAISKWETKGTIPIEKFAALAAYGFDVQYILTGLRSINLNQLQDEDAHYQVPRATEALPDNSLDARVNRLNPTHQHLIKTLIEELEHVAAKTSEAKDAT